MANSQKSLRREFWRSQRKLAKKAAQGAVGVLSPSQLKALIREKPELWARYGTADPQITGGRI